MNRDKKKLQGAGFSFNQKNRNNLLPIISFLFFFRFNIYCFFACYVLFNIDSIVINSTNFCSFRAVCEMAGPGFDGGKNADPKMAAISSQCIHTASGGYGTRERKCHQNWLMGNCGEIQIGQR